MKIFNGTPHSIDTIDPACVTLDSLNRKSVITCPIDEILYTNSIPSSGVLSARFVTCEESPVFNVRIFKNTVASIDPLPDGFDMYIVSAVYANAMHTLGMDTSKIYLIHTPVYLPDTTHSTVVGCIGLAKF